MFHTLLTGVVLPVSWLLRSHLTYQWIPPNNAQERETLYETAVEIATFLDTVETWVPFDQWFKPLHVGNVFQLAGIQETLSSLDLLREILEAKSENINYVPKQYLNAGLFEQSLPAVEAELTQQLTGMFATHLDCSAATRMTWHTAAGAIATSGHYSSSESQLWPAAAGGERQTQPLSCIEKKDRILYDVKIFVAKNLESMLEREMFLAKHRTHADRVRMYSTTALLESLRKQGGDLSQTVTTERVRVVTRKVVQQELERIFRNHRAFAVEVPTRKCGLLSYETQADVKIVATNGNKPFTVSDAAEETREERARQSRTGRGQRTQRRRKVSEETLQGWKKVAKAAKTHEKNRGNGRSDGALQVRSGQMKKTKLKTVWRKVEAKFEHQQTRIVCEADRIDYESIKGTSASHSNLWRELTPDKKLSALVIAADKTFAPEPYNARVEGTFANRWVPLPHLVNRLAEELRKQKRAFQKERQLRLQSMEAAFREKANRRVPVSGLTEGDADFIDVAKEFGGEYSYKMVEGNTNVEQIELCPEAAQSAIAPRDVVIRLRVQLRMLEGYAARAKSPTSDLNEEERELGRMWTAEHVQALGFGHVVWGTCKPAIAFANVLREDYFKLKFREYCDQARIESEQLVTEPGADDEWSSDDSTDTERDSEAGDASTAAALAAAPGNQVTWRVKRRPHDVCRLPSMRAHILAERTRLDASMMERAAVEAAERDREKLNFRAHAFVRGSDSGDRPAPYTSQEDIARKQFVESLEQYDELFERIFKVMETKVEMLRDTSQLGEDTSSEEDSDDDDETDEDCHAEESKGGESITSVAATMA